DQSKRKIRGSSMECDTAELVELGIGKITEVIPAGLKNFPGNNCLVTSLQSDYLGCVTPTIRKDPCIRDLIEKTRKADGIVDGGSELCINFPGERKSSNTATKITQAQYRTRVFRRQAKTQPVTGTTSYTEVPAFERNSSSMKRCKDEAGHRVRRTRSGARAGRNDRG
ncbi:unnamed protein product, partial [Choristocarpus tenellus]